MQTRSSASHPTMQQRYDVHVMLAFSLADTRVIAPLTTSCLLRMRSETCAVVAIITASTVLHCLSPEQPACE